MSYEIKRITDDYGYELYEVWRLTDDTIAYMTKTQCRQFFAEGFVEENVHDVQVDDVIGEYPYPHEDIWYDDLQNEEWNRPECPNCGSRDVVDHRAPHEKQTREEHWYCKECRSDW